MLVGSTLAFPFLHGPPVCWSPTSAGRWPLTSWGPDGAGGRDPNLLSVAAIDSSLPAAPQAPARPTPFRGAAWHRRPAPRSSAGWRTHSTPSPRAALGGHATALAAVGGEPAQHPSVNGSRSSCCGLARGPGGEPTQHPSPALLEVLAVRPSAAAGGEPTEHSCPALFEVLALQLPAGAGGTGPTSTPQKPNAAGADRQGGRTPQEPISAPTSRSESAPCSPCPPPTPCVRIPHDSNNAVAAATRRNARPEHAAANMAQHAA